MSKQQRQSLIHKLIASNIRQIHAYQVADASGLVKLDAMENPYRWTGQQKKLWLEKLQHAEINRYPDPQALGIKQRLREKYALDSELGILLGNGSDEIIQLIIMAIAATGRCVLAPSPSFVMYKIISDYLSVPFIDVALNQDFSLNTQDMLEHIERHKPAVIFLATPNNPTANNFSAEAIGCIIEAAQRNSGLVVLDEAYSAFTQADQMHWLQTFSNVFIMRTFSKVGLAALRLGFLIAHKDWVTELDKFRLPYNINILSQLSVEFALDHYAVLNEQSLLLCEQRSNLMLALKEFKVFECYPSEANFITIRCLKHSAKDIFQQLKEYGILIKCLHATHPLLDECLRITVSRPEENQQLIAGLKKILDH